VSSTVSVAAEPPALRDELDEDEAPPVVDDDDPPQAAIAPTAISAPAVLMAIRGMVSSLL
jgi:hypothetical protein